LKSRAKLEENKSFGVNYSQSRTILLKASNFRNPIDLIRGEIEEIKILLFN
jgi:hypothetical protein